jgi:ADP-ribosyl-[dinitrogen reductase] hydrolase
VATGKPPPLTRSLPIGTMPPRDNRDLLQCVAIRMSLAPRLEEAPAPLPTLFDWDRVDGMLLGLAIGDALGNTSEGRTPAKRRQAVGGEITGYLPNGDAQGRPVGLPSDDSQMAFWTLEQLLADGGLVPAHLADRFASRPIAGLGGAVTEFLSRYRDERRPWAAAGVHSAGNGALMRIAPILLPHLASPSPALWADAALAGMVTHNDRASNASCVAFVDLLWRALALETPPPPGFWLRHFVETAGPLEGENLLRPRCARFESYRGPLTRYTQEIVGAALADRRSTLEICEEWGSGAFLMETVPSALLILERHGHSAPEAILRAVNDTWDNDTLGAIVGAAVGALHGRRALPAEWIDGLLGRTTADDDGAVFGLLAEARRRFSAPALAG